MGPEPTPSPRMSWYAEDLHYLIKAEKKSSRGEGRVSMEKESESTLLVLLIVSSAKDFHTIQRDSVAWIYFLFKMDS